MPFSNPRSQNWLSPLKTKKSLETSKVICKSARKIWRQYKKNWEFFFSHCQWLSLHFTGFRIGNCGCTGDYRILKISLQSIVAGVISRACFKGWVVKKKKVFPNHQPTAEIKIENFATTICMATSSHNDAMYQYGSMREWKHYLV